MFILREIVIWFRKMSAQKERVKYSTRVLRVRRPFWLRQLITPILSRFLIWRGSMVIQITP